jgi:hypothetical protein
MALLSSEIAVWLSTVPLRNDGVVTLAVKVGQLVSKFITAHLARQL